MEFKKSKILYVPCNILIPYCTPHRTYVVRTLVRALTVRIKVQYIRDICTYGNAAWIDCTVSIKLFCLIVGMLKKEGSKSFSCLLALELLMGGGNV